MKAVTIEYNPITGAQMTEKEIFPSKVSNNAQEQKALRASHEAAEHKNTIKAKRTHSIQHKQK